MMPTRYTLDVDLKNLVTPEALESATKKVEARKVRADARAWLFRVGGQGVMQDWLPGAGHAASRCH